jgi:hypothetical protein
MSITPNSINRAPTLERGRIAADTTVPEAKPGARGHADWLVDESVEESFPASDPPSAVQPGSLAGSRSRITRRAAASREGRTRSTLMWLCIGAVLIGGALGARRLRASPRGVGLGQR